MSQIRLFLYGTLVEVVDLIARPVFWLLYRRPGD